MDQKDNLKIAEEPRTEKYVVRGKTATRCFPNDCTQKTVSQSVKRFRASSLLIVDQPVVVRVPKRSLRQEVTKVN